MKSEWQIRKFSDIAIFNPKESIQKGAIAKKVPMDKLQPFCRDITEYTEKAFSGGTKFRNGDTIMARITPCLENGKTAKVSFLNDGEVGFGSTEYIVFRAIDGQCDEDYLYYLVTSPLVRESAIKSMVGSSGRQRVQTDVVQNLNMLVPPYDVQKRISGLLKSLDDKIAENTKVNKNLEQQAQALFKSWFVDFEPFGGVMPENWKIVKFGEIMEQVSEKSDDENIPMFSVTDTGIYPRNEKFKKELSMKNIKAKIIYANDLIFGMSREILNWGIMHEPVGRVSPAYNVYRIHRDINSFYVEGYMKLHMSYFKDLIRPASREGQGIDKSLLLNKTIYLPTESVLHDYYRIETSLKECIQKLALENQNLSELRDTLLPKLMSGEIDVSNVSI